MINVATALNDFYSSFGIPAYEENSVPDNAKTPYITYELVSPDWRDSVIITANIWYKGSSFSPILKKADEIKDKIGEGLRIPVKSGGCVYLTKGSPFSQMAVTDNDKIKSVYLLINMLALCK